MSQPCGCDYEHKPEPWLCEWHRKQAEHEAYRKEQVHRALQQEEGSICMLCLPNDSGVSTNPDCPVCHGTGAVLKTYFIRLVRTVTQSTHVQMRAATSEGAQQRALELSTEGLAWHDDSIRDPPYVESIKPRTLTVDAVDAPVEEKTHA